MRSSKNTDSGPEIQQDVRSAYRAIANETPSTDLDRSVLREATRSASRSGFAGRLHAWIHPVAIAAAAVLGVSVIVQFNLISAPFPTGRSSGEQSVQGATDELSEAVETTGRRLREFDRTANDLLPANKPSAGARNPSNSPRDRYCDAEMTRTAADWWACIENLNRLGESQAARSEFELLNAEFPGFSPTR